MLALVGMLAALIMDKMRPGMILFSVVVLFLCTGILSPKEMLEGFSNKGMITVALLFLVSEGIRQSGALTQLIKKLLPQERQEVTSPGTYLGLQGTGPHPAFHRLHFRLPEQYAGSGHFRSYHQTMGELCQASGHLLPHPPVVRYHPGWYLYLDWNIHQPGGT